MPIETIINYMKDSNDLNDCLSNCSNNGLCVLTKNKFTCVCDQNYGGNKCQIDLRPCYSNPCLNNATCYDHNNHSENIYSFTCVCDQFHYGTNCEMSINVCENETCSSKGICFGLNYEPKCKCFKFYSGEKCEIESSEMKNIKVIVSTSRMIAIGVLISLFLLIF